MYYPDFPYYQQYYYFNNYMPKYGYNAAFGHPPAVSPPQTTVGMQKQSQRKSKEVTQYQGINSAVSNSLVPSSAAQSSSYNSGLERQESNKESEAYKQQIIQWLKSLQMDERFEVFMIREKWFAQTIIKMFWKQKTAGDSAFALYSEEDKKERKCVEHDSLSNAIRREGEQELIRVLRILDTADIYDCLVFDRRFLEDIDHVVEIFDLISDSNVFATPHFQQWSWFNQNSFQTIASWIVSQFERIIQFRFLEDRHKFNHKQNKLLAAEETNSQGQTKDNINSNQELKSNVAAGSSSDSPTQSNNQSTITHINKNSSSSMISSSNGDSQEIKEDNVSTQENLCHFQNILAYWGSLNASKKKKILNKSVEMHRKLVQQSQIEGAEKHDRPLEWYKKKREIFYNKCKPPNDEEIQQYFSQFSEESQANRFMETMCFTTLEDTTNIMTVVLKKMHDAINEMYAEQIEADLILNDQIEKNSKKKKNQKATLNSSNSNSSSLKKKKLQSSNSQNSRSQMKSPAANLKNNTTLQIQKKEKTFAEEVNLLHQANQLLETTGKQRHQNEESKQENNKNKGQNKNNQGKDMNNGLSKINSSLNSNGNNHIELQNDKNNQRVIPMQSLKQEAVEICCMQNKCEMLEISKAIAARLISNCIQGLDRNLNDNEDEESVSSPKSVSSSSQFKQQEKQQQQQVLSSSQQQRIQKKKKKEQIQQQQLPQIQKHQQIISDDSNSLVIQAIPRNCHIHAVSCGEETDEVAGIKEAESSDFSDDNHIGQTHKSNHHKTNHTTVDDSQEGGSTQTMACSCDYYTTKKSPLTPPAFSDEEQLHPCVDQTLKYIINKKNGKLSDNQQDKNNQIIEINQDSKSNQQQQVVDILNTVDTINNNAQLKMRNAGSDVDLTKEVNHGHDDFIQVQIKKKKDTQKNQDKGNKNNKHNSNNVNTNNNNVKNRNNNNNNNQKSKIITQNNSEISTTQSQSQLQQEINKKNQTNNNKKQQSNANNNQNTQNKSTTDSKQHKSMVIATETKEQVQKLKKTQSTSGQSQQSSISETTLISKKEDCSQIIQNKLIDSNNTTSSFTVSLTKKIICNDTFPAINTIDIHRETFEEDNSIKTKQSNNGQIQLNKQNSITKPSSNDKESRTQKELIALPNNGISISATIKSNGNIFDKNTREQSPKTPPSSIPQLLDTVSIDKTSKEVESSQKLTPVKNLKQRLLKQSPLLIQSHGFIPSNYPEVKEYSYNFVPFNNTEQSKSSSQGQIPQEQTLEAGLDKQISKQSKGNNNSGRKKSNALLENTRKQSGNGANNCNTNNNSTQGTANQWKDEINSNLSASANSTNGNPINQSQPNIVQSVPTISQMNKTRSRIAKKLFRKKITADIVDFTDLINAESFRYQPSRYIIFLRIQLLLKKIFGQYEEQVDLRIFGSCATGLSLPTSDIDLGITGFEMHPRSDLIYVLTNLANVLEKLPWVKSIERIFTANIPIIKMEVDPMLDFSAGQGGIDDLSPAEQAMLNMSQNDKAHNILGNILLKVDITVECQMQSNNSEILNHMGFLSTDFVVRWMSYYARLQPMTIIMKCFLHARNLNTNFKGGISSYCLLILIIAFFRDNQNIAQSEDYSNILLSFLKLYGTSFNPEITGISLSNSNPFFCTTRNGSQSKLQVVDPLTGKVMTQNTYLIDEILKEFNGFYNKLNEFQKTIEKYLEKYTFTQLERLEKLEFSEQIKELTMILSENQISNIITNIECTKMNSNNINNSNFKDTDNHNHKNNNNSNGLNNLMDLPLHSTCSANQTSQKRHKNHHGNTIKKAMSQQTLTQQQQSQDVQKISQQQEQQQNPLELFEQKQQQPPLMQQANQINQQQQKNQVITEGISQS